ncbi:hypothetical protein FRB94_000613 [Tulasnella sp. JGI-2019a]|nr:hypothetical protein FRB94_000613 [Tulasnella sp. JGI-2019a]KAG9021830.1 hypothetical protein FRB95_001386 [Tulasnella sp. JGI-2019a]
MTPAPEALLPVEEPSAPAALAFADHSWEAGPSPPKVFSWNPYITQWAAGDRAIKAGAPYINRSYKDCIKSFKEDLWAHCTQDDQEWFKKKSASLKIDQHNNTHCLQSKGKGHYDLEFACLLWAEINVKLINCFISILQEVLYRHYQAVELEKKGELSPEALKKAVVDKLCWNDKQLPQPFAFNPELSWTHGFF